MERNRWSDWSGIRNKRKIAVAIVFCLILLSPVKASAQERITFDGYWWGTISREIKLGFVQGFIDGAGSVVSSLVSARLESYIASGSVSPEEAAQLRMAYELWQPFEHNFKYYIDRIDGFYRATGAMTTPVNDVMIDLMAPLPAGP